MQKFTTSHPSRRGFSLVEILVVITIIASLSAIAFPVANKIIKESKLEENRFIAVTLERAIEDFYGEYNYYPLDVNSDDLLPETDITEMLNTLSGKEKTLNSKGKNFISALPDANKSNRNGLVYGSDGKISSLTNSFGNNFNIILDGNFDKEINEPNQFGSAIIKGKHCLIWSFGEDKDDESAIITTWQ